MRRSRITPALVAACALVSARAAAQPAPAVAPPPPGPTPDAATPEVERAKHLVEEGRLLGERGDWSGALGKLREAAALAESPGLRFDIAFCEEHLGKLLASLTDYRLAKREAARGGAPEVSAAVGARIAALEPRISSLAFQRPAGAERAVVFVDGAPLADPASGRTETDPGPHRITALLDGATRFDRQLAIAEGESRTVTLVLAPLPPPVVPRQPPVLGYVLGASGLLSLGTMGIFIGLRQSVIASLPAHCSGLSCNAGATPDIERGRVYTGVAEGAAVLGAVALGAGIVLVARSASSSSKSPPRVGVALGPDGPALKGAF